MRIDKLSQNFTFIELVNTHQNNLLKSNINCGRHPTIVRNLKAMAQDILQPMREHFNSPVIINSGYRCPQLNKKINGSQNSQHMYGEAADFFIRNYDNQSVFEWLCKSGIVYGQCILEPSWIHISYPKMYKDFGINLIAEMDNGTMKYLKV